METLKNIIKELPRWRHVVLGGITSYPGYYFSLNTHVLAFILKCHTFSVILSDNCPIGYAAFMQKSIPHTYPDIMDKALKRLASFVLHWRNAVESNNDNDTVSYNLLI